MTPDREAAIVEAIKNLPDDGVTLLYIVCPECLGYTFIRTGEDERERCERCRATGYVDVLAASDLQALVANYGASQARVEALEKALREYEHVCAKCLSLRDDHDENGQVDMMDELGTMICGVPYYPAAAALKKCDHSD